jgi:hypothetical protein
VQRIAQNRSLANATAGIIRPSGERRTWEDGLVSLVADATGGIVNVTATPADWCALCVWIGTSVTLDWPRTELLWRMLSACEHRVIFELSGNQTMIRFTLRCHRDDLSTVRETMAAVYPTCALTTDAGAWWRAGTLCAYGELCAPWSLSRLTLPAELPDSALWACVEWLLSLPQDATGFYHCVCEPATVTDVWHRRVERAHDAVFLSKLLVPQSALQRVPQQLPSGELRLRAQALQEKANGDLPFFGVTVRCGIVSESSVSARLSRMLTTFRLDGWALTWDEPTKPPSELTAAFFSCGATYRPGIMLNSAEITTVAHLLPARDEVCVRTDWPRYHQDISAAQSLVSGCVVGHARVTGMQVPIAISDDIRARGTHAVSCAGMGKSTVLKHVFLQDVAKGNGAVYIDPHGDALKDLMALLPESQRDRCIYFNPSDADWVPCWNPLTVPPGADLYRVADDLLSALERVSQDWGDRLATVLRHALVGLLHLPGSTMHDIYNVVRQNSPESDALRDRILEACPDVAVRQFWQRDFLKSYREADLAAPRHKLLKLVSGGAVSRMFSQPHSRIDVRAIMDEGNILLVDLSGIGAESRSFLGSFLLTLFVVAATGRATVSREQRKPFSVFADEAHLFVGADAFESLIAQARKFRVNVVLAHQYLGQFKSSQVDALLTAGSTLVGRVNRSDAAVLAKNFQGKFTADDICQLRPFEMIARIGTEMVRFSTPPSNDRSDPAAVSAIINASRSRYYVSATAPAKPAPQSVKQYDWDAFKDADLSYDEF